MTALVKLGKMFFNSPQKLFSFPRKSDFRILDFQISWHHQMPLHKTRNTFYWITWEVNTVSWWNLASLCHITKGIIAKKGSRKTAVRELVPDFFVFSKSFQESTTSLGKWNFWRNLLMLDM